MTQKINQPLIAVAGIKVGENGASTPKTDPVATEGVGIEVLNIVSMTQAEYDALAATDENTLYLIRA